MKKHRGLCLALGLAALMGFSTNQAGAETITMTIQVGGGPAIDLSTFGGVGTAQGYSLSASSIALLNSYLTGQGSEYQFAGGSTNLGGGSNNTGTAAGGQLVLTGSIESVGAGIAALTITETEGGFTAPTGPSGTLFSSSSATFSGQAAGGGHTASSTYTNGSYVVPTTTYSVLSTGVAPNSPGNSATASVMPVATLYTLSNTITFGLGAGTAANPITDTFGVTSVITAAVVPEPASVVMFLTGMPVPLMVLGMLRRRKAAKA